MKGWFDAFRNDGGPTLYSYSNRTPVTGDVPLIIVFVVFGTLFTAFLVIFPGVRKERLTTFLTVTLSLFVGATIQVAQYGSSWHTSSATIISSYSAFSKQRTTADIGGYIGLMHINITYKLLPGNGETGDVEYNERFWWRSSSEMTSSFKQALYQGAPFPIVSLAEYFSLHQEGFSWGARYREAGYYASIMLWTSFASWMMMNLLLMVVPRYGAYSMIFTGFCMLLTNIIYTALLPCEPLIAHVEGSILSFDLGWSYWLVLLAGAACLLAGLIIAAIDLIFPHQFSTILEVDYDTPYDRHVIIEESFDTRNIRRKVSKTEDSLGNRIMSQLSSKLQNRHAAKEDFEGVINQGYTSHELSEFPQEISDEVNKSNWSYPFPPVSRRTING
ncbi:dual oxidase maturation factor 1 [Odontomachus brunneus]|uniref:dual oxidase maturation factor 1 n=1 Tax=Odontomachus brunneus TaxID=486640 RepID=UPI0013F1C192|nr:dual oxidase maturation factor 1 [Odontomachus brunneus]XP_032687257.1 dual oxidase maturation factor 1 [Odontomachus brunneus]XP_032687258.1 dual oxidase maturation factor 1 [Odontomachus brunneus]